MPFSFPKVIFFDIGDTLVQQQSSITRRVWIPEAKNTLNQLHAKNVRLGLISNTPGLTRTQLLNLLPIDFDLSIFEPNLILLSSEVNVEKPKPAIFLKALERSSILPTDCLFCGDELIETIVAQKVGMQTFRVSKPPAGDIGKLIQILDNLLSLE